MKMIEPKEIIRSRRRTIALEINAQGELIVRAPFRASMEQIMDFVERKQDWICDKTRQMQVRRQAQPHIGIAQGDQLYYKGELYPVIISEGRSGSFDGSCFHLPSTANTGEMLTAWYRKQAARVIIPRVEEYAARMGVEPKGVRITSARTRWGSCSYVNYINFSWHLVMCPEDVINYVVVHELCHIWHKDHSRLFWASVAEYDPDYKEHRRWLREHGILMEENW
ncbi:MAG: M48 family metallopeptidase [Roseburia sp.]|nr:M48 family metallopeptidase [Roseburia sp.]